MPEVLQRTPLHALHAELGAKFTPFAGYEMPVQYGDGLRAEHLHTRSQAGLFDVSHMGQLRVTGRDAEKAVDGELQLYLVGWSVAQKSFSLQISKPGGIED